ncbi:hypothetical protein L915_19992 [Phytophthora nicotianae]|uniref:PiggyBac transposable element-derived protein domain-containing protein n=1 Tax=Phytophthora nicotianae TaxID=4792 RepID=W2FQF3_PHYNI|nr:hypothetical protein L915_19992 [Phytophthora nicotianae]
MAFDEAMLPSRSSFNRMRVYMKDKPHKWGTKLFMLVGTVVTTRKGLAAQIVPDKKKKKKKEKKKKKKKKKKVQSRLQQSTVEHSPSLSQARTDSIGSCAERRVVCKKKWLVQGL